MKSSNTLAMSMATLMLALLGSAPVIAGTTTSTSTSNSNSSTSTTNATSSQASSSITSLSASAFYLTGKYGNSQSTSIYYLPLTLRSYTGRFGFSISLPYLRKTGPSNVIPNLGSIGGGGGMRTTHSGMGDVRLGASYRVWDDHASGLALTLGAKVKLGTASYANGLGTGQNDYALQAGLSRSSGPLYLAIIGGYRMQGSPPGVNLRNVAYGEADVIYRIDSVNNVGVSTFYTQASLPGQSNRLMSVVYFGHHITHAWSATGYLMKGFTNSSPDTGVGASIRYRF